MSEHLSDDELAYHRRVLVEVKAAQAAWASWSQHIGGKYQLGPKDTVSEDGVVARAPAEADSR